jgi:hypothetical protein
LRWDGKLYQIQRKAVVAGLRGAAVRVEKRLDGSLAVRHRERYLPVKECALAEKPTPKAPPAKSPPRRRLQRRGSDWNKDFDLNKGPKIWQAAEGSGCRPEEAIG